MSTFSIKLDDKTRNLFDPLNVRQPLFAHSYVHVFLKILMDSRTSVIELNKMTEGETRKGLQSIQNK